MQSESAVLAHTMDRAREYTLYFFNKLKDQDLHLRFVCDGKELNSAYWIMAHLATSENGLLLMSTGGPFRKFSWAKHFTLGSDGLPPAECPPFEEVFATMDQVHQQTMAHLPTLGEKALDGPNMTGIPTIGRTVRDVITHAIRHEGSHCGQLGWLCKLYGVRTM